MLKADLINILFPPIFILYWLWFVFYQRSTKLTLASLFFISIAAFSQNFSFIFRELHQLIQLLLLFISFYFLIRNKSFPRVMLIPLLFLFLILFSLFNSVFDADSITQLINFLVVFGMLNLLFVCFRNNPESVNIIFRFIGVVAFIAAFSGIVEFIFGISERIEGTFANPNYFALFIGLGWSPVYCYFKGIKKYLMLATMLIAIVLSGSRSALVFPVLFAFWIIYTQSNNLKMVLYGFSVAALLIVIFISGVTRFSDSTTLGSDAERVVFAKIALNMAADNPVSGVGWGRFISEFSNYSSTVDKIILDAGTIDASKQDRRVTHNDFLRIVAELGFFTFILSLLFVVKTGILISRYKGFGVDSLFPCWSGLILFSLTHNNLNTAFSWFFILLPWFLYSQYKKNKSHVQTLS